jgi:hypothetical protein
LVTLAEHFFESRRHVALVLCTGVDASLIMTRAMILERAGHKVVPALSEPQVTDACKGRTFDVAVIGQAVSPLEKIRIFNLVRMNCPRAKVLELFHPPTGKVLRDADDWLEVPTDIPANLAERVSALAARA